MVIEKTDGDLVPLTDLALIGYLVSLFPIARLDTSDPREIVFFFEDSDELQDSIDGFWNNTVTVHPLDYFSNIKNLKTRIRSER